MVASNSRKGGKSHPFRGRILVVLGLILSFYSLVLPFYNVEMFVYGFEPSAFSAYFWSFKGSGKSNYPINTFFSRIGLDQPFYAGWTRDISEAPSYPSSYFDSYWFNFAFSTTIFAEAVITLFALQLLTLGFALASLFRQSTATKLAAASSGLGVIIFMLYVMMGDVVRRYPTTTLFSRVGLGFWLAGLAELVFLVGVAPYVRRKDNAGWLAA